MSNALVSVIVPVYNNAAYLDECIGSLTEQTYPILEIILVDDGSDDGSGAICDRWRRRDQRITVIHQSNQGAGMARNAGLEHIHGDYICFVDSDDWLERDCIEKALRQIEKEQTELVVFGMLSMKEENGAESALIPQIVRNYRGREVQDEFLRDCMGPDPKSGKTAFIFSTCLCMYSAKLIKRCGWRFVSEREILSEDYYSLTKLLADVRSVTVFPEALYHYRCNPKSLSRRYMEGRYERIKHFYLELMKLCREKAFSQEVLGRCSYLFISNSIAAMKQLLTAECSESVIKQELKRIITDEILQSVLYEHRKDRCGWKKRMFFAALRRKNLPLCYFLLRMRTGR